MNKKEHIDQVFYKKLSGFEPGYQPKYWKSFNSKFYQNSAARKYILAACISIIGIFSVFYLINTKENEPINDTIQHPATILENNNLVLKTKPNPSINNPGTEMHTGAPHQKIFVSSQPENAKIYDSKKIRKPIVKSENAPHTDILSSKNERLIATTDQSPEPVKKEPEQIPSVEDSTKISEPASVVEELTDMQTPIKPIEKEFKKEHKRPFSKSNWFGIYFYQSAMLWQDDGSGYSYLNNQGLLQPALYWGRSLKHHHQIQLRIAYNLYNFSIRYNKQVIPSQPKTPIQSNYKLHYLKYTLNYTWPVVTSSEFAINVGLGLSLDQLVKSEMNSIYDTYSSSDAPFMNFNKAFISPNIYSNISYQLSGNLFLDFIPMIEFNGNKGLIINDLNNDQLLKLIHILPQGYLGIKYNF